MEDNRWTQTIEVLNLLLRDELSAVESYAQALTFLSQYPETRERLQECHRSHSERAGRLRAEVQRRRGEPTDRPAPWRRFAKILDDEAVSVDIKTTVGALSEGEQRGLQTYREILPSLEPVARRFVYDEILPAQLCTLGIILGLQDWFEKPAIWYELSP